MTDILYTPVIAVKSSSQKNVDALIALARRGPLRARDLTDAGIPRVYLQRLVDTEKLERVARGLYRLAATEPTERATLTEVAKRMPRATICLLSALQLHGMTDELPHAVWVMLDRKARLPQSSHTKLHVVRAGGSALTHGIDVKRVESVPIRVTNPARTVADCFRYRSHVGLDVALAALREYRRKRKGSMDALLAAATTLRVARIMRPYIEATS